MDSGRGRGREGKDAGNDGKIDHPASQGGAQFEEGATPWHADQGCSVRRAQCRVQHCRKPAVLKLCLCLLVLVLGSVLVPASVSLGRGRTSAVNDTQPARKRSRVPESAKPQPGQISACGPVMLKYFHSWVEAAAHERGPVACTILRAWDQKKSGAIRTIARCPVSISKPSPA
jgi:hypothetical protein